MKSGWGVLGAQSSIFQCVISFTTYIDCTASKIVIWTRGTDKIEVFKENKALENLTKTKALWTTRYRAWRLWKVGARLAM